MAFVEDFIWAIHASTMAYYSFNYLQGTVYGGFAFYLFTLDLPRIMRRIKKEGKPLFDKMVPVKIVEVDMDTVAWQAPMLLSMPLLQTIIYSQINYGSDSK